MLSKLSFITIKQLVLLCFFSFFVALSFGQNPSIEELDSLSDLYFKEPNFKKSLEYARLALNKTAQLHGTTDTMYSKKLLKVGVIEQEIGNYKAAEQCYVHALEINEKKLGKKSYWVGTTYSRLGDFYYRRGEYEKAEFYDKEALNLMRELFGENNLEEAICCANLALLYTTINRLDEAENLYEKALFISTKVYGANNPEMEGIYMNFASFYRRVKKYKEAEEFYLKAQNLIKKRWGEQHPNYGRILNNMGVFYKHVKQYDKAEKMYREGLRIRTQSLGPNHFRVATVWGNLAMLFLETKRYDEAEKYILTALEINKNALGEKHERVAGMYNILANTFVHKKQYEDALVYIKKSLESNSVESIDWNFDLQTIISKNHFQAPEIALNSLELYAAIYNQKYNQTQDILMLQKCLEGQKTISFYIKKAATDIGSSKDQMAWLSQTARVANNSIKTASKLYDLTKDKAYVELVFSFAEDNKSALLSNTLHAEEALVFGNVPDSLVEKEHLISEQLSQAQAALVEATNKKDSAAILQHRTRLLNVNLEKSKLRAFLEQKYPKYSQSKHQINEINISQIQANVLDDKTALLEYFVGDSLTYLIVVTKQQVAYFTIFLPKEQLSTNVTRLRKSLSDYSFIVKSPNESSSIYKESAHFFYKRLIEPALTTLNGIEHLIIIPDRELGHLPFEAFLTKLESQSKETNYTNLSYLINQYSISYSYSASLLLESNNNASRTHNGQLLAFAAFYPELGTRPQEYDWRTGSYTKTRGLLQPLKAVQEEVKSLETLFSSGQFFYENNASEKNFKKVARDYAIIHLAMHGILNEKQPMLSSLVFTEDGDSLENNFLEAYEIANLQLNSELVVLSACETGYGKFQQGEGVLSLARSFMYAGVPALVVSLWQVNDASTSLIMKSFYENLKNGMTKNEALRQAKLTYIKQAKGILKHPAFWSPFIQLGNSKAIKVGSSFPWLWCLGGVLTLLMLLLGVRRIKK